MLVADSGKQVYACTEGAAAGSNGARPPAPRLPLTATNTDRREIRRLRRDAISATRPSTKLGIVCAVAILGGDGWRCSPTTNALPLLVACFSQNSVVVSLYGMVPDG